MSGAEVVMIVSLKSGLAPFTRRDVAALVDQGISILLVPSKVGAGVCCEDLPAPVLQYSIGARVVGVLRGLMMSLRDPRGFYLAASEAIAHHELASLLLALQARAMCPSPRLVYSVFGDRKFLTGYFLSIMTTTPLAVTIHAYELYANPSPDLFRKALAHATAVMTVTEYNRELLDRDWGHPCGKTTVVRVTVDGNAFDAADRYVVLMVGSWTDRKGHEDLLDALVALDDPSLELWIVGGPGGNLQVDLRREARTRGVEASCVFFGQLPESAVAALMRRADVLVQPSRRDEDGAMEGFPTSVAEAMYSGLPVIVTDHAEMPRIVESIVVPERDPVALAEALARYRDDPALRQRDGERNRAIAERLFGESAHDALLRVLRGAMRDA
jgi:glycosyltransferase involved in cell wall biosynthesis